MPRTLLVLHRGGSQLRGSEEALLTLLRGLDPAELRPVLVCDQPALRDEAARCGVEAHLRELPEILFDGADRRFPLLRWLRAVRALAALARDADLVLCSGGGPCQLGVPAAALARRPLVCLLHHPAPRRYHWLWLVRGASALVFTSRFTAEHTAAATGLRGPVVYAGIDAHRRFVPGGRAGSALRRALGYGDGDVVFAQVGALVPHKGHAVLLEAFAAVGREMPEARLLIVGGGPLEEEMRREVAARGLAGAVALTGYVPDADPCFREVMDVNVLASHEEGLGLVNLQALACEVPCVATDGTGIRETVEHGRTGLLFPDGDAAALAAAMLRLGRSPGLRGEMGRAGRRRVLERFSHTACCASMREILLHHAAQGRRWAKAARDAAPDPVFP
jgi:glycosyltransferase involved in cell wall biosynthesis